MKQALGAQELEYFIGRVGQEGIMANKGYCVRCKKHVEMEGPIKTKLRNNKTKNMTIDAIKGRCPDCQGGIYHILGHS